MKKIIFAFLLILISTVLVLCLFRKQKQKETQPIKTEKPSRRTLIQLVTASGNLKAKEQISVGSLVAGKVVNIKVEDNDEVKKDQILAILDDGIGNTEVKRQRAILEEAKAHLEFMEKYYNRQRELYKSAQISQNTFDQVTKDYEVAKSRVDQAQKALELAQQTYDNLFIKSPADGIVIAKRVDLGQMVTAQLQATVLFEIAKNLQEMEAHLDVDEADIGMVKEGQDAVFTVDSFPKKHFDAIVKRIQYQAKIVENVVTYATVLDVHNPKLRLRPGMTTNVEIKVAENKDALAVSNKALRLRTINLEYVARKLEYKIEKIPLEKKITDTKTKKITKDFIWILEGKTIKQTEVKLGINDGRYTEIIKGVSESSEIITEVEPVPRENPLLKGIFGKPAGIGNK